MWGRVDPRIVIVQDQAADLGGQERVVESLLEHYPTATALAPRFTATNRPVGHTAAWDERTRLIGSESDRCRPFLAPLYARRVARAGELDADIVVSVTYNG